MNNKRRSFTISALPSSAKSVSLSSGPNKITVGIGCLGKTLVSLVTWSQPLSGWQNSLYSEPISFLGCAWLLQAPSFSVLASHYQEGLENTACTDRDLWWLEPKICSQAIASESFPSDLHGWICLTEKILQLLLSLNSITVTPKCGFKLKPFCWAVQIYIARRQSLPQTPYSLNQ